VRAAGWDVLNVCCLLQRPLPLRAPLPGLPLAVGVGVGVGVCNSNSVGPRVVRTVLRTGPHGSPSPVARLRLGDLPASSPGFWRR
jgi:hypothetical protein